MGTSINSYQQFLLVSLKLLKHIAPSAKFLMLTHNFKEGQTGVGWDHVLFSSFVSITATISQVILLAAETLTLF